MSSNISRWIRRFYCSSFEIFRNDTRAVYVFIDGTRKASERLQPTRQIDKLVRAVAAVENFQSLNTEPKASSSIFAGWQPDRRSEWWLAGSSSGYLRPLYSFMASLNFTISCACFSPFSSHASARKECTFSMKLWSTVCDSSPEIWNFTLKVILHTEISLLFGKVFDRKSIKLQQFY